MKKSIIMAAIALSMLIITSSAYAAVNCWTAGIVNAAALAASPTTGAAPYAVKITCPTNFTGEREYYLATDLGDSGYATLLTAISLGQSVSMELGDWTWGSLVTNVRLKAVTP